jgi:hypothetical protein
MDATISLSRDISKPSSSIKAEEINLGDVPAGEKDGGNGKGIGGKSQFLAGDGENGGIVQLQRV